ncbi:NUDIX domain-containing protein [Candidatus Curtissbacteria bacterium]|nr:NUDIX domain-containing protein [Candidatus Curtissbacteria bacterium]
MPDRVVPFSGLTPEERQRIPRPNWVVQTTSGEQIPDWSEVYDPGWATISHIAVINNETGRIFDKIDLHADGRGVFVVVFRRRGEKIEFLLPEERRVLLKDENGQQGNVYVKNIPQGQVRFWEHEDPKEAALREVKEETGLEPISIQQIGEVYFSTSNSHTKSPFFLAEVDATELKYQQSLGEDEDIKVGDKDWYAIEDIPTLELQCKDTLAGLFLATGFLGLWNKDK